MMEGKLVLVRWLDVVSMDAWVHPDEVRGMSPMPAETVGWLVCEDEDSLTVVTTRGAREGPNTKVTGAWCPRSQVCGVIDLAEGTPMVDKPQPAVAVTEPCA